ncbi:hypothetical protein POTOM_041058 [Populus tomentosa]|uniref:Glutathione S-transferase n=1 Tax=Populus tomentosa TaxID=118781 RepID=A0A8X8CI77_POPTO|nr:hypothetical protein POTOM_041058 [Populus tomentosa]
MANEVVLVDFGMSPFAARVMIALDEKGIEYKSKSMIIVQYIDEVWSHKPSLLPSDPYRRAHARFWADYINKKIYPIGSNLWASVLKESKSVTGQ